MQLKGWDYTGRNFDRELNKQFRSFVLALRDKQFTQGKKWTGDFQNELAAKAHISSSGVVRTLKTLLVKMGLIDGGALKGDLSSSSDNLLTQLGEVLLSIISIEERIIELNQSNFEVETIINEMYERFYMKMMIDFYYPHGGRQNKDLGSFHPLRAVMKALRKFKRLDKWEWYMLNTIVLEDDNREQEEILEQAIGDYRNNRLTFNKESIVLNAKGHQYLPQYLEAAGFIIRDKKKGWTIMEENKKHSDITDQILSSDFLTSLYGN